MADELQRHPKHLDFMCAVRGIGYTGNKLEPYTRNKLRKLHQDIYVRLAGLPPCTQQCSSILKPQPKKWCQTCNKWKQELARSNKRGRLNFENAESWKWPYSYEKIAEVFLPTDWANGRPVNFSDISTLCKIWDSCKEFDLKDHVLKNVRDVRNSTMHSTSLKLNKVEKAKVFDALKDLIKDPDAKTNLDVHLCMKELAEIETGDTMTDSIRSFHKELAKQGITVEQLQADVAGILQDNKKLLTVLTERRGILNQIMSVFDNKAWLPAVVILLLICLVVGLPKIEYSQNVEQTFHQKESACLSEDYIYPFPQDMPLLDYFSDHKKLVGRKWLFEDLERKLLNPKERSHGIVTIAEFGYGKSAFISHLLCAPKGGTGDALRENVVAFHVCKFDVASTKSPERFIRRLVGFFATKSPQYGHIISMLPNTSVLYDSEKCAKEIEACFDQAFRNPFKRMENEKFNWIVVVDALDECFHSPENTNFIMEMLSTRIQYFPTWIQFLITSRDMRTLKSLRKLEIMKLLANDSNNLNDIEIYINEVYKKEKSSPHKAVIQTFLERSEGNFLYLTHALHYILSPAFTGDLPELPLSLEDIYELNFDRQFDRGNSFETAKVILEIISVTLNPLNKDDLFKILKEVHNPNITLVEFEREFERLEFFLKSDTVNGVTLGHKAMYSWLTGKKSTRYSVYLNNGHTHLSKYLLKTAQRNERGSIVDLAIHLSNSLDKSLHTIFQSIDTKHLKMFDDSTAIHQLIEETRSADALKLLLLHQSNVTILDKNQMSAAFLAASKGHLHQLRLLIQKGSALDFVIPACPKCVSSEVGLESDIQEIKSHFYTGYGLLHIAIQHKDSDIVGYLIRETNISLSLENAIGQRPSDIACENGYLTVLKYPRVLQAGVLDSKCLYHAAKHGHLNIVEYLLKIGIRPACIKNHQATSELDKIKKTCHCNNTIVLNSIRPLDTWWIVIKDSPLHSAIRSGHFQIAKLLMNSSSEILSCSNAYGFTPFLLAIRYNKIRMFREMLHQISSDKCSSDHANLDTVLTMTRYLGYFSNEETCPEGATFAHLVAIYNRTYLLELLKDNTSLQWNKKDALGNKPIHYAAGHSNSAFIGFLLSNYGRKVLRERTKNGSTPYHIAAITRSDESMKILTNNFKQKIPDVKDYANRSTLHYSVAWEETGYLHSVRDFRGLSTFEFLMLRVNVTTVDMRGYNILHYILRNGHFNQLLYLQRTALNSYKKMLNVTSIYGHDPVTIALIGVPHVLSISSTAILQAFSDGQISKEVSSRLSLTSWEACLLSVIETLPDSQVYHYFIRNLHLLIVKSSLITKAVLIRCQNIIENTDFVRKRIIEGIKTLKCQQSHFVVKWSLYAIVLINKGDIFIPKSGASLKVSPAHYFILNLSDRFSLSAQDLFQKMFETEDIRKNSTTSEGFNFFHYALMGGNIPLAEYFIEHGIETITDNVSAVDILFMAVFARYKPKLTCNGMDQLNCIDSFVSIFVNNNSDRFKWNDFCSNGTYRLSLVHIFAINGMNRTLKTIGTYYGIQILRCVNFHNFSAFYFANLFGRKQVINYLGRNSALILPYASAEESFLMNLLNFFPYLKIERPTFCLTKEKMGSRRFHTRYLIKDYKCLHNFFKRKFMSINEAFRYNYIYNRHGLYLFRKFMLNYIRLKNELTFSKHSCKAYEQMFNACLKSFHELTLWANITHDFLFHPTTYPFIQTIIDIMNSKLILKYFTLVKNTCEFPLNYHHMRHLFFYLEKAITVLIQNFQDIVQLLSLMDMKSPFNILVKGQSLNDFMLSRIYDSGFPSCWNGCIYISKEAITDMNQYRYLSIVKSTIAYKEMLAQKKTDTTINGPLQLVKTFNQKQRTLNKMLHSTRKRKVWMQNHLLKSFKKCPDRPKSSVATSNQNSLSKRTFITITWDP